MPEHPSVEPSGCFKSSFMPPLLLLQTLGNSYAALLSPPSRSFHTQLRYADFSSSLLQQQQMASMDSLHGVMPLLQVGSQGISQVASNPTLLLTGLHAGVRAPWCLLLLVMPDVVLLFKAPSCPVWMPLLRAAAAAHISCCECPCLPGCMPPLPCRRRHRRAPSSCPSLRAPSNLAA